MARLVITGATGRLGLRAVPFFTAAGYEVTALAGHRTVDLRDPRATGARLAEARPDIILHLAGLTDVDACESDPAAAYEMNVRATENLAAVKGPRLILASTDQVYDGDGLHREDRICIRNTYAFSKRAAELAALRVGATCLRINFFGRAPAPAKPSLSDWIVTGLREKTPMKLLTDVFFAPLSMTTLLDALLTVMRTPQEGVFNLGSHDGLSKAEFGLRLAQTLGLSTESITSARLEEFTFRARRPRDMRMDVSRFESMFGMRLPTLAQEIARMKEDYAKA